MENNLSTGIECRLLEPGAETALARFFKLLEADAAKIHFHPHPFTKSEARRLANYNGQDLYYVLIENGEVLGYGMLRGWDEGYEVPSLGIAIHPKTRGQGLGFLLMNFLHVAARQRGAHRVRLKVHRSNGRASQLYKSMGYRFANVEGDFLIGFLDL